MINIEFKSTDDDIAQQLCAHLIERGHAVNTQRMDHDFHVVRVGESMLAEQTGSSMLLKVGTEPAGVEQAAFAWLDSRCERLAPEPLKRNVWFYALCAYGIWWGLVRSPGLADTMADGRPGAVAWVAWIITVLSATLFIIAYLQSGLAVPVTQAAALAPRQNKLFIGGAVVAIVSALLGLFAAISISSESFAVFCAVPLLGGLLAWHAFRKRQKSELVGRIVANLSELNESLQTVT